VSYAKKRFILKTKLRGRYHDVTARPSAGVIRKKHYSIGIEQACVDWMKRFILFQGKQYSKDRGEAEISQYNSPQISPLTSLRQAA